MNGLQLVSALNWVQAVLLLAIPGGVAVFGLPLEFVLVLFVLFLLLAAPFVYLALVIDKGRGRVLQTIVSGVMVAAFPVGTLLSTWLYVVWISDHRHRFEEVAASRAPQRWRAGRVVRGAGSHYTSCTS